MIWLSTVVFIFLFELIIPIVLPYFSELTVVQSTDALLSANVTSVDLVTAGFNPFETFAGLMSFSIQGAEFLSLMFYVLDIILIICLIQLARGTT